MITYSDETTDKTATVNALVENNTETLETSFDQIALSSRKIIITAGNGVRVCKVKAYVDDMTNLQKLYALANYINNTTHYPGAGCTKKDINPTFYNDFSVDGIGLFYYLFPMPTLNRVMDLQGGITTCIGVTVVQRAATEDLKLPYLYDSSTKTVADGEGVWLAVGSASSNPSVGSFGYLQRRKRAQIFCRLSGLNSGHNLRATWLPGKSDSVKNFLMVFHENKFNCEIMQTRFLVIGE